MHASSKQDLGNGNYQNSWGGGGDTIYLVHQDSVPAVIICHQSFIICQLFMIWNVSSTFGRQIPLLGKALDRGKDVWYYKTELRAGQVEVAGLSRLYKSKCSCCIYIPLNILSQLQFDVLYSFEYLPTTDVLCSCAIRKVDFQSSKS